MKLNSLIDFLPYEFKDQDTYKVNGKGILERYLEIFGTYFQDVITSDIDNILDIIDIDKTPGYYLNLLWEFLGELPFANTPVISEDVWKTYFSGFKDEATMNRLCDQWLNNRTGVLDFDTDTVRKLLKCSIALFKIRGTKKFFTVLFRLYGLGLEITDPAEQDMDLWIPDNHPLYDEETMVYDKNVTYDNLYRCTQCVEVPIRITGHGFTSATPEAISFKNSIEALFERFLPYFARPVIDYDTVEFKYQYQITAEPQKGTVLIAGEVSEIPILVTVKELTGYADADLRYEVSGDNVNWTRTKYNSPSIYIGRRVGILYFRCVGDPNVVTRVQITEEAYYKVYNLYGIHEGTTVINGQSYEVPTLEEGGDGTFKITTYGTLNYRGNVFNNLAIRLVNTGEIKTGPAEWVLEKGGTYTWQLVDFPVKQLTITVIKEDEFTITCDPVYAIYQEGKVATTVVTVKSKYTKETTVGLYGEGQLGPSPYTFNTSQMGTFAFYCLEDPKNERAYFTVGSFLVFDFYPINVVWASPESPVIIEPNSVINVNTTINITTSILWAIYLVAPDPYDTMFQDSVLIVYNGGTEVARISAEGHRLTRINQKVGWETGYTINASGDYTLEYRLNGRTVTSGVFRVTQADEVDWSLNINPTVPNGWDSGEPATSHTFKFDDTNTVMEFTLTCESLIGEGAAVLDTTGETYEVNTGKVYSFTKDDIRQGTYKFTLQDIGEEQIATLIVQKQPPVYTITCNPTEVTLASNEVTGETDVYVTMDPVDTSGEFTYDILIDGGVTPFDASPPNGYHFSSRAVGIHTFVVRNDPTKSCTFEIKSNSDVSPDSLTWEALDTTQKEVTITTKADNTWTAELI